MKKRIMLSMVLVMSIIFAMFESAEYQAAPAGWYTIYINCDGGTFEQAPGVNLYDTEHVLEVGTTLASDGKVTVKDPTCAGKTFLGWLGYNKDTGAPLDNGKLFTTQEIMNYPMPAHAVEFKAQWQGSTIKAITYAALYAGTGDVDYNVKVTLVHDGISYSGQGFVTIPESIYATWTGNVYQYWEFPGEYINANYQYIADYFDAGYCSAADFKREKNCWQMMFKYSGEPEAYPSQSVVDNFFTYASTVAPNVSTSNTTTAGNMISDTSIVPANYTITTNQYQSGDTYNKALKAAQDKYGSSNVLVYNIDLKDANGTAVHQLSGTVDVKLQMPTNFSVQTGNTVVVYYLNDDGTLEACATAYDATNKIVTFKTNHFSVYVVAEVEADVEEETQADEVVTPDTDDVQNTEDSSDNDEVKEPKNTAWIWIVVGVAIVAVVVVAVFMIQKKK